MEHEERLDEQEEDIRKTADELDEQGKRMDKGTDELQEQIDDGRESLESNDAVTVEDDD